MDVGQSWRAAQAGQKPVGSHMGGKRGGKLSPRLEGQGTAWPGAHGSITRSPQGDAEGEMLRLLPDLLPLSGLAPLGPRKRQRPNAAAF